MVGVKVSAKGFLGGPVIVENVLEELRVFSSLTAGQNVGEEWTELNRWT